MIVPPIPQLVDLCARVFELVNIGIGARVQRRTTRERMNLEQIARDQELQAAHTRARIARDASDRERRLNGAIKRYPLGEPGRVRRLHRPGLVPSILISPVDTHFPSDRANFSAPLDAEVETFVRSAGVPSGFMEVITGAFVSEGPALRIIGGNTVAAEVAGYEFSPNPAIVVYFQRASSMLTCLARVSDLFPTTDGGSSFTLELARLGPETLQFAIMTESAGVPQLGWEDAPLPAGPSVDGIAVMTNIIAAFTMAMTKLYWQAIGVHWAQPTVSRPLLTELFGEPLTSAPDQVPAAGERPLESRVREEVVALNEAGFAADLADLENERFAVSVYRGEEPVMAFELDRQYPNEPPRVLLPSADGTEEVLLDTDQWSCERSLVQLVMAVVEA